MSRDFDWYGGAGSVAWDPEQYAKYADERGRPFFDLTARIAAGHAAYLVDLGCGDGALTAELARRWPGVRVTGVDSSPEMLAKAPDGISTVLADIAEWEPDAPVDVLVSNAALQWVPEHGELLPRFASWLAPGGWIALQVPGNYANPHFEVLRELARSPRWADRVPQVPRSRVLEPADYLDRLAAAGCTVDAWETTYLHVLHGPDAVLEWTRGTALRPILAALSTVEGAGFTAEYGAALRDAYPERPYGTLFPFRRIFVVGRRA
jgi:trans-aconitate 2-methyltransferase